MKKDNLFFTLSIFIFIFSLYLLSQALNSLDKTVTGSSVEGLINVTIERAALVNFTIDNIDWGSGYVYANASSASLDTLGNVANGTWDVVGSGFVIENIGNVNLTLNFSSLKNASTFLGGTNPSYKYIISNVEDDACVPPPDFNLDNFYEFPTSGTKIFICDKFQPGKNIKFDIGLTIPYNSKVGNLTDTISLSFEEN